MGGLPNRTRHRRAKPTRDDGDPDAQSDAHADKSNPFNTSSSDWAEIRVTLLLNALMAVGLVAVAAFYGNLSSVYAPKPRRRTSAIRSGLRGTSRVWMMKL